MAPLTSLSARRLTGRSSTLAMIESHSGERAPPPIASTGSQARARIVQRRQAVAHGEGHAFHHRLRRCRATVSCDRPAKAPRMSASLCGVRSPER